MFQAVWHRTASAGQRRKEAEMSNVQSPPDSAGGIDRRTYLDSNHVIFPEFGCYVALSEDRRVIFTCAIPEGRLTRA